MKRAKRNKTLLNDSDVNDLFLRQKSHSSHFLQTVERIYTSLCLSEVKQISYDDLQQLMSDLQNENRSFSVRCCAIIQNKGVEVARPDLLNQFYEARDRCSALLSEIHCLIGAAKAYNGEVHNGGASTKEAEKISEARFLTRRLIRLKREAQEAFDRISDYLISNPQPKNIVADMTVLSR